MNDKNFLQHLYVPETADHWANEETMKHASGVFGRVPMLNYLKKDVIKNGDTVVDLGSGGGFTSNEVAEMVGENGKVIGVELSKSQLGMEEDQEPLSKKYEEKDNLHFINGNVLDIPLEPNSADNITSFMMMHNLKINEIKTMLKETSRIIKSGGKAVFLTMHPDFLESDWELSFSKYDKNDLKKYREAEDKEDIRVDGMVNNAGGDNWKPVGMYYHSEENIEKAAEEAGLKIVDKKDCVIDKKTAEEKYGKGAIIKKPEHPAFWIITLEKINTPK